MKYRALVNFTGLISMGKGQVREISDLSLARDLLKAKYIEEYVEKPEKTQSAEAPTESEALKKEAKPKSAPKKSSTKSPKKKESKK